MFFFLSFWTTVLCLLIFGATGCVEDCFFHTVNWTWSSVATKRARNFICTRGGGLRRSRCIWGIWCRSWWRNGCKRRFNARWWFNWRTTRSIFGKIWNWKNATVWREWGTTVVLLLCYCCVTVVLLLCYCCCVTVVVLLLLCYCWTTVGLLFLPQCLNYLFGRRTHKTLFNVFFLCLWYLTGTQMHGTSLPVVLTKTKPSSFQIWTTFNTCTQTF